MLQPANADGSVAIFVLLDVLFLFMCTPSAQYVSDPAYDDGYGYYQNESQDAAGYQHLWEQGPRLDEEDESQEVFSSEYFVAHLTCLSAHAAAG